MLRRKRVEDPQHADRWLISYADFITLLFAFFVVMYSISQVNEGKYRILSESLVTAFDLPDKSLQPIQVGEINRTDVPYHDTENDKPGSVLPGDQSSGNSTADINELAQLNATAKQTQQEFKQLEKSLDKGLQNLIDQGVVKIKASEDWIEIELPSGLLFRSGSDKLGASANLLIRDVSDIINKSSNLIRIRGFTDNVPVEGGRFSSNWDLSASRSVSVVQLLQSLGVDPNRLAIEGYGEYAPVSDNVSELGRSKNRRVVIAISRFIRGKKTPLPKNKNPDNAIQNDASSKSQNKSQNEEDQFELIRGADGRLIIRGKDKPTSGNK